MFLSQLSLKSKRIRDLLAEKNIEAEQFFSEHLLNSTCLVKMHLYRKLWSGQHSTKCSMTED